MTITSKGNCHHRQLKLKILDKITRAVADEAASDGTMERKYKRLGGFGDLFLWCDLTEDGLAPEGFRPWIRTGSRSLEVE